MFASELFFGLQNYKSACLIKEKPAFPKKVSTGI